MAGAFGNDPNPAPAVVGGFLTIIMLLVTILMWGWALLEFLAAHALSRHKWYIYGFVMGCLEITNLPLGTLLGVFTIVVLARPSVKALYEGRDRRREVLEAFDDDDDDVDDDQPTRSNDPDDGSIRPGKR